MPSKHEMHISIKYEHAQYYPEGMTSRWKFFYVYFSPNLLRFSVMLRKVFISLFPILRFKKLALSHRLMWI